jgi:hypothetical protein
MVMLSCVRRRHVYQLYSLTCMSLFYNEPFRAHPELWMAAPLLKLDFHPLTRWSSDSYHVAREGAGNLAPETVVFDATEPFASPSSGLTSL